MSQITRRRFLEDSMWAAASAAAVPAFAPASSRAVGANEKIRVACVGLNGRGMNHLSDYLKMKDVEIAALCDVDDKAFVAALKAVEKAGGKKPEICKDMRKMVEDKNIDAVSIATTNHTHTLLSIWAIQAGKHVYVEKPLSHNLWEGRKLVEAARKYNRVVQHGTQSRSSPGLHKMIEFLRSGQLGKVNVARGLCYKRRKSIGKYDDEPVMAGVDYDLWLGPAPLRPFNRNRFHYNWHWHWDYGNGDIGNQGVHEMDRARWGLGKKEHPKRVTSLGGRLGYEDQGETPNTQVALFEYGDSSLIFEVRGLDTDDYKGAKVGVIFHCENGYVVNPTYGSAMAFDAEGKKIASWAGEGNHYRNFIDAVRTGDPRGLMAEVEEGHMSAALCHLAHIPYRLGKPQAFSATETPFGDSVVGNETFLRMRDHLKREGVDLGKSQYIMGPSLAFDPKTEKFVGNAEADRLLTREYRKPFVVPETV